MKWILGLAIACSLTCVATGERVSVAEARADGVTVALMCSARSCKGPAVVFTAVRDQLAEAGARALYRSATGSHACPHAYSVLRSEPPASLVALTKAMLSRCGEGCPPEGCPPEGHANAFRLAAAGKLKDEVIAPALELMKEPMSPARRVVWIAAAFALVQAAPSQAEPLLLSELPRADAAPYSGVMRLGKGTGVASTKPEGHAIDLIRLLFRCDGETVRKHLASLAADDAKHLSTRRLALRYLVQVGDQRGIELLDKHGHALFSARIAELVRKDLGMTRL